MSGIARPAIAVIALASVLFAEQRSADEKKVWSLEDAYWQYVKANDFEHYRTLWHEDFLGWPSVSAAPVRKDRITDWITAQTSKGLTFKNVDFNVSKDFALSESAKLQFRSEFFNFFNHANFGYPDNGSSDGIYGQILLSHALATVTGFPVVFSAEVSIALLSFLIVTAVAVAIVAVPGHIAARARPAISLQE